MKIAGIDVHKKVLMVVVIDARTPEEKLERRRFATMPSELRRLSIWLREQGVEEAVMESTAQYWRSVWLELEPHMRLHLAQAFSNRAPRGRKHDFKDAERLVRRLIANELILSLVPDGEQRIWRSMTRMKLQLTRDRVRLQNQMECLLEEMRIKCRLWSAIYWAPAGFAFCGHWPKGRRTLSNWRNWEMSGCSAPRSNWWML
jgi:transposase